MSAKSVRCSTRALQRKRPHCITMGSFILKEVLIAMDKPFKNLDEQISILSNRGIVIDDKEYAKDYLLRNNYYNVINCYGRFFMPNDKAYSGTNFKEIVAAHLFDEDLKSAYFRYILITENSFKSIVAYEFSEKHQIEKDFYLNPKNYNGPEEEITKLIDKINKVINKYKKKPGHPIAHYSNKYNNLPLWVLINYLTFGQVLKMFELLDISTKNSISKQLNKIANKNINSNSQTIKLSYQDYYHILSNILYLRNASAHDNTLLHFNTSYSLPYISVLHDSLEISSNKSKNDLYQIHIIMQLFLTKGQYCNLSKKVNLAFMNLDKKVITINPEEISSTTGFPCSWIDKQQCEENDKNIIDEIIMSFKKIQTIFNKVFHKS